MRSLLPILIALFISIAFLGSGCGSAPQAKTSAEAAMEYENEQKEAAETTQMDVSVGTSDERPKMTMEEAQALIQQLQEKAKESEKALVEEEVIAPQAQNKPVEEAVNETEKEITGSVEETVTEPMEKTSEEIVTEVIDEPVREAVTETDTEPVQSEEPVEAFAFKVNGVVFSEQQVEDFAKPSLDMINQQYADREKDDRYNMGVKNIRFRAADALITKSLISKEMEKENIVVTEDDIDLFIADIATSENMTVDELKSIISRRGDFEVWKQQMQLDIRKGVARLVEKQDPESLMVSDEEVSQYYKRNERMYNTPEQVKASHILIKPDMTISDQNEADAKAKIKAIELLAEIKAGADFAELAKENSACPSSANGGDLGYGSKRTWVPNFSDAAFALEEGQVSDVVKTRFGYHIIKATGRKPAKVTTLDEVKDSIKIKLRLQKEMRAGDTYIWNVKKQAQIEFSEAYKELGSRFK
jgi:peptidyl-prolyl cis-trans isomerase C